MSRQQRRQTALATFRFLIPSRTGLMFWAMAVLCVAPAMGQQAANPRVVIDFESADAITLHPAQARGECVEDDGDHALRIETEAAASWPGVLIKPKQDCWDLSEYDTIKMDVRNPEDVPVRVLLCVNNPGADGRNKCNTGSVQVPAQGRATLALPFGTWHGDTGHPIDQANIVSMMVMLDRPGRGHRFLVDNIRVTAYDPAAMKRVYNDPFFKRLKPAFGRGVNLGNALEAPKEGVWGVKLEERYFDLIKDAGFDSVRIPARWSAHAEETAPYRIDPEFIARAEWAVNNALQRRLFAVLNIHHYEGIMNEPTEHRERFLALWQQIAEHFKDAPPALTFELLNEPHAKLDAGQWNRLLVEALGVIRRTNPTRKIVVGPVGWNSLKELQSLELPEDDRNLIITFHYYSPFKFTHQGAGWVGNQSKAWLGTQWTGTKAEQRDVVKDLDEAIIWAVEHRRPIFMGEFGAYSKADLASRARWTKFVADEALRRKIGFAYWEFCSGFGVYDAQQNRWVEPLREALVPKDPVSEKP